MDKLNNKEILGFQSLPLGQDLHSSLSYSGYATSAFTTPPYISHDLFSKSMVWDNFLGKMKAGDNEIPIEIFNSPYSLGFFTQQRDNNDEKFLNYGFLKIKEVKNRNKKVKKYDRTNSSNRKK
jgi:hypothetical protein